MCKLLVQYMFLHNVNTSNNNCGLRFNDEFLDNKLLDILATIIEPIIAD